MIVRTSQVGDSSFDLLSERMVERTKAYSRKYFLLRSDLRTTLRENLHIVEYFLNADFSRTGRLTGYVRQGKTQRNKKFISIGCMRFVGENRKKLIRWAKSGK